MSLSFKSIFFRKHYVQKEYWCASTAKPPKWPWKCRITKTTAARERNDVINVPIGFNCVNGTAIKIVIIRTWTEDFVNVQSLLKLKLLLITTLPKFKVKSPLMIQCYLVNFVTDWFRWGNCLSIRYKKKNRRRFYWKLSHSEPWLFCVPKAQKLSSKKVGKYFPNVLPSIHST